MTLSVGAAGEQLAAQFLRKKGYRVLKMNYRVHGGEIDIICRDGKAVVFVEVKTRIGEDKGKPYEAVTYRKFQHIKHAAQTFIRQKGMNGLYRIDVVSILLNPDRSVSDIRHFENVQL